MYEHTIEETFVITFYEQYRDAVIPMQTLWHGKDPESAVETFRASFDEVDIKKVRNVKVYKLTEVVIF